MCILVCRVGPDPLLAANRDEVYARPFRAPRPWVGETTFWAPRDEEEGGTWLGVNAEGLMTAITNRSLHPQEPGRASRGLLVTGVLAQRDLAAARAWLEEEVRRAPRNPCQLYAAQGDEAFLYRTGDEILELPPGFHVLSNLHDLDEIDLGLAPDAGWEEIRPILADTSARLPKGYAVCKRGGWRGTVASTLIVPGKTFLFADGPPDEVAYSPVSGYPS
jgi:uncharacterized protein with NRDE domain